MILSKIYKSYIWCCPEKPNMMILKFSFNYIKRFFLYSSMPKRRFHLYPSLKFHELSSCRCVQIAIVLWRQSRKYGGIFGWRQERGLIFDRIECRRWSTHSQLQLGNDHLCVARYGMRQLHRSSKQMMMFMLAS